MNLASGIEKTKKLETANSFRFHSGLVKTLETLLCYATSVYSQPV